MISREKVRVIVEGKVREMGCFLVDIKTSVSNNITVFFDKIGGIFVDDCRILSKHIEEYLDRDEEDYELTVCSPGLENPLMVDEQYQKYIGKEIVVQLKDGKRKKGILISYNEVLVLEVSKKKKGSKKDYILEQIEIPKNKIKETKLKINFK